MPGRDYTHAFALLEQSLGDNAYSTPSSAPLQQPSFEFDDGAVAPLTNSRPFTQKANLTPFASSHVISGQDSSFPPTPPPSSSIHLQNVSAQGDANPVSRRSLGSGLTTPTNPQSLPTPETTPPRLQDRLTPNHSNQHLAHSPYTESFQTAQEDLDSINSDQGSDKAPDLRDLRNSGIETWPGADKTVELRGLGMDMLGSGSRVSPPPLRHRADFLTLDGAADPRDGDVVRTGAWDADRMKKITTLQTRPETSSSDSSIPLLMRDLNLGDSVNSSRRNSSTLSSSSRKRQSYGEHQADRDYSREISPISENGSMVRYPYDLKTNRLSGTSGSSTVVEAMVIDRTPPPQKRKLRHVGKAQCLREDYSPQMRPDSSASESSPIRHVAQVKKSGTYHNRYSVESPPPMVVPPAIPQRSLRRQTATIPQRPLTAPEEPKGFEDLDSSRDKRRVVSDPLQISAVSIEDMTPPPPSASPASSAAGDFEDTTSAGAPDDEFLSLAGDGDVFGSDPSPPLPMPGSFPRDASTDHLAAGAEGAQRDSLAISLGYSDHSRQLYGASPRSMKSEATEDIEINEAAAVMYSVHTNNSLLVVNHTPPNGALRRQTVPNPVEVTTRSEEGTFITLEQPASPEKPQQDIISVTSSPLANAKSPLGPPELAVIPPTPARELEEQEDDGGEPALVQPTSLFGRARRYSESFIQPITEPFRRSRMSSSKNRSQSAQRVGEDGRLHPEWRPKWYWADLHYTSDEEVPPPDENLAKARDEVASAPERVNRMGSIRGFLVGNTLGFTRGPTNKRRHVVNLPANKRRKQTHIGHASSGGHVTVRESVKRSGTVRKPNAANKIRKRQGPSTVLDGWRAKLFERSWMKEQKLRDDKAANLKANIGLPTHLPEINDSGEARK